MFSIVVIVEGMDHDQDILLLLLLIVLEREETEGKDA